MTEAENILWYNLRNQKLHGLKVRRQHVIFYEYNGSTSFYVADFYIHQVSLIIELDGSIHNFQQKGDQKEPK
ncbi:MAG: DUF559 domain-containing protein [Ignavibacteriales bacterium]|nr:DUF559 domain-containing protein [Ignavibacteriales bacterium]